MAMSDDEDALPELKGKSLSRLRLREDDGNCFVSRTVRSMVPFLQHPSPHTHHLAPIPPRRSPPTQLPHNTVTTYPLWCHKSRTPTPPTTTLDALLLDAPRRGVTLTVV